MTQSETLQRPLLYGTPWMPVEYRFGWNMRTPRIAETYVIGQNLKRVREEKGIGRVEMAASMGVCREAIKNVENGYSNLSIRRVRQFAAVLGVHPEVLLAGAFDEVKLPEEEPQLQTESEPELVEPEVSRPPRVRRRTLPT